MWTSSSRYSPNPSSAVTRLTWPANPHSCWSRFAAAVMVGSFAAIVAVLGSHHVRARTAPILVSYETARVTLQESTPQASAMSVTPAECLVTPRPVEDFASLMTGSTPAASVPASVADAAPVGPSQGETADAVTVDAINLVVAQLIGCANAGDLRRASSLYTDELFRRFFGGIDKQAIESLLATPTPLPVDLLVPSVTIEQVRMLEDDRVGVVVRTRGAANYLIFAKVGERYLLDNSVELVSGRATPRR